VLSPKGVVVETQKHPRSMIREMLRAQYQHVVKQKIIAQAVIEEQQYVVTRGDLWQSSSQ
jgi:hypothetical protein